MGLTIMSDFMGRSIPAFGVSAFGLSVLIIVGWTSVEKLTTKVGWREAADTLDPPGRRRFGTKIEWDGQAGFFTGQDRTLFGITGFRLK
jgi:hypothetical protein